MDGVVSYLEIFGSYFLSQEFVQDAVLAASALYAAAAVLVGKLQKPISLGTARFWDRLDGLRHTGLLPFRVLEICANSFKLFSVIVWVGAMVSVLYLVIAPEQGVSLLFGSFASGTFDAPALETVRVFFQTVSLAIAPFLFTLLISLTYILCWSVVAWCVGSTREPPGPGDKFFFPLAYFLMLVAATGYLYAVYQAGLALPHVILPGIYGELVRQVGTLGFRDIFLVSFFGSVFLTTTVFFVTCCLGFLVLAQRQLQRLRETPRSPPDVSGLLASLYVFAAGLTVSFLVTTLAARLGFSFRPDTSLGLTLQLLLVNAVFDGLTLAVTVRLLFWAAAALHLWNINQRLETYLSDFALVGTAEKISDEDTAFAFSRRNSRGYITTPDAFRKLVASLVADLQVWHEKGLLVFANADVVTNLRTARYNDANFDTPERRKQVHTQLSALVRENIDITSNAIPVLKRRFPVALVLDAGLAFLFCLAVLFFGFLGTAEALTWREIWHVATGGFDGQGFAELGPLFWVTHTTFLPTVVLWVGLVVMFVLSSVVSRCVDWLLKIDETDDVAQATRLKVRRVQRSLAKTSTSLAGLGGVVGALGFLGVWS